MKMTRKKQRKNPEISTASLPDIVFMLLFFFMVATVMRKKEAPKKINIPMVTNLTKIKAEEELRIYLPAHSPTLILKGKEVPVSDVGEYLQIISSNLTIEEKEKIEVMIYADELIQMQNLYEVKLALRKNNLRKINYMAQKVELIASK